VLVWCFDVAAQYFEEILLHLKQQQQQQQQQTEKADKAY